MTTKASKLNQVIPRLESDLDTIITCAEVIKEQARWLSNTLYELDKTDGVHVSGGGIHRPTEILAMDYADEAGRTFTLYEKRRRLAAAVSAQVREARGIMKVTMKWLDAERLNAKFPRPLLDPIDQRLENAWDNEAGRKRTKRFVKHQAELKAKREAAGGGFGHS